MRDSPGGDERLLQFVKVRRPLSDNSCGRNGTRNSERSSLSKAENPCTASTIEPDRFDVILHRLQQNFYDQPVAAEHIAAAVMIELKTLDESSSALSY